MTTLSDLRALLERALVHAENPAIQRLPEGERTVEGLAGAYLPRRLHYFNGATLRGEPHADSFDVAYALAPTQPTDWPTHDDVREKARIKALSNRLDLTDPGTAHAVLVALALAQGLDPGVGGLACMWVRDEPGWSVVGERGDIRFTDPLAIRRRGDPAQITAVLVALEPDPIKALALAVRHVLEAP